MARFNSSANLLPGPFNVMSPNSFRTMGLDVNVKIYLRHPRADELRLAHGVKPWRTPGAWQTSGDAILEPLKHPTDSLHAIFLYKAPLTNRVEGFTETCCGRDGSRTRSAG